VHELANFGQTQCQKHHGSCGVETPTVFVGVVPCKQLSLILDVRNITKTVTQLAKEMGQNAANTKAMIELLVDLQPPIVILQLEKFSNASFKAAVQYLTKELKKKRRFRNASQRSGAERLGDPRCHARRICVLFEPQALAGLYGYRGRHLVSSLQKLGAAVRIRIAN
jgi:hypothetical protein